MMRVLNDHELTAVTGGDFINPNQVSEENPNQPTNPINDVPMGPPSPGGLWGGGPLVVPAPPCPPSPGF